VIPVGGVPAFLAAIGSLLNLNSSSGIDWEWGAVPQSSWADFGRKLAEEKKPAQHCEFPHQAVISRWWNGRFSRAIEFAYLMSPAFVSTRLGYLSRKEYWRGGELESRWSAIKAHYEDDLAFMVQLSAVPGVAVLTGEKSWKTDTRSVDNVRFVLLANNRSFEPISVKLVHEKRTHEEWLLSRFPWQIYAVGGNLLMEEFEKMPKQEMYERGQYFIKLYEVRFRLSDVKMHLGHEFSLRVLSTSPERKADFSFK
jgi:hypothetical protein